MYILKKDVKVDFDNQSKIARTIGIDKSTLNRILQKKQGCSKRIAYSIVKASDKENEINDYFEFVLSDRNAVYISVKVKDLLTELAKQLGQDINKTLEEIIIDRIGE